jgi:hypothetical protein
VRIGATARVGDHPKAHLLIGSTIDGFIAGPDGGDPTMDGYFLLEGDHMQALTAEYPETIPGHVREVLGVDRAPHLRPRPPDRDHQPYPHMRQYVFSRSITDTPDPQVEIVSGDPVDKIRQLERLDGNGICLAGGFGPLRFKLVDARVFDSGAVLLTYAEP